jgi:hypothetical protein
MIPYNLTNKIYKNKKFQVIKFKIISSQRQKIILIYQAIAI